MPVILVWATALASAGVNTLLPANAPTTSPRDSNSETMRVDRIVRIGVDADVLRTGVDLEGVELAGGLEAGDGRVVGRGHAVVDLDVAHRRAAREDDRAALDALVDQALRQRVAGDRGRRRILAGVADTEAMEMPPSNELVVATGMPFFSAVLTMSS